MGRAPTPHDVLFRYVFGKSGHAAALLRWLLPRALGGAIDWRTLARDDTTLVDRKLRRRHADLLFTARYRRSRSQVYLVLEHSSTEDPFTVFKLLGYGVRIGERCCRDHPRRTRLPLVLAVVVHHGDRPFRGPRSMLGLTDLDALSGKAITEASRLVMEMPFVLVDLATMSERRLLDRRLTDLARLALLFPQRLRHADSSMAATAFRRWRRPLGAVARSPGGAEDLEALFTYMHATTDLDLERLRRVLAGIDPEMENVYMTTADRLLRQGRKEGMAKGLAKGMAKGLAEGRAKGMEEGKAATLLRQLQRRFGPLPDKVVARIGAATIADLDGYADRVLTAKTLDEVLAAD